jgi:hypothetical protein
MGLKGSDHFFCGFEWTILSPGPSAKTTSKKKHRRRIDRECMERNPETTELWLVHFSHQVGNIFGCTLGLHIKWGASFFLYLYMAPAETKLDAAEQELDS